MHIIEIYGKQYECSKCKGQVNYGAASEDGKTPLTKDGKPFNNKWGKESNKLSVAVNAGTVEIHPCYANLVEKDYAALTGEKLEAKGSTPLEQDNIQEFTILWNKVYQQCSILAAQVSDERTDALGKHITTCGIVHDYFSYIK
jgi:hypothetical protein